MKPFLNKIKKIAIILLNALIIIVSSYFICKSDKFQKKLYPKKYWQNKIITLESELKNDSIKIKFLKLDLEKENALSAYHKEQAKIIAENVDENFDEIFKKIEKEYFIKINEIKQEIRKLTNEKEEIKNNLDLAYNQIRVLN